MKYAKTNCKYCKKEIRVSGFAGWSTLWEELKYEKSMHELIHLLNGTDVYSQMERGLK